MLEDFRPELGEPQAACRSFEQPHAKLILELGDPSADRGDRRLEAARRLGKAAGFNNLREHHQRIEIRHRLPVSEVKEGVIIPYLEI